MHPANVRRLAAGAALTFAIQIGASGNAAAQTSSALGVGNPIPVSAIEWDMPEQGDTAPGAILVDMTGGAGRIWMVTRAEVPRVYRVDLGSGKKANKAHWFAWQLDPDSLLASGLRRIKTSKDKRFVYVRTTYATQRIDTADCTTTVTPPLVTCTRLVWDNLLAQPVDPSGDNIELLSGSDVAVDDYNRVYTAIGVTEDAAATGAAFKINPVKSFIERLDPNSDSYNVVRWYVGGGAGFCRTAIEFSFPCLSGVAINPRGKDLVYYSEPQGGPDGTGALAELDPATNYVRRWTFKDLNYGSSDPASEPRQLQFDSDGILWAVTGSGHLVNLDPKRNRMAKHRMPDRALKGSSPFGVAPDGGFIGYTDADPDQSKVGMLIPARNFVTVYPVAASVVRRTFTITPERGDATRMDGFTSPMPRKFTATRTTANGDTFIEASTLSGSDSVAPSGIVPDMGNSVGTFFYAVSQTLTSTNRFGWIRLPRAKERARVERDNDDQDEDGKRDDVDDDKDDDGIKNTYDTDNDNDGDPDMNDDDDDNDGVEDSFDTPDKKESRQTSSQDVVAGDSALDQFVVNPGTLIAVLSATSSNALAPVSIEILNDAGQVVASSLATPGAAVLTWTPPAAGGTYTLRVKNQGTSPASLSTKILSREVWPL